MNCESNNLLEIIIGDLFSLEVEIEGADPEVIKSIWFSSQILNFSRELTFENENWTLYISSDETKNFPIGIALFDLTAEFIDGNFQTATYNGRIVVKQKINEVAQNE